MIKKIFLILLITGFAYSQAPLYRFAVIGDFGDDNEAELKVSLLVKSWNPSFIITTGDNNYDLGEYSTIDSNIGKYYYEFIYPYYGTFGINNGPENRFFPSLGNHDWYAVDLCKPYLNYFTLPAGQGRERYYDFIKGNVHFFAVDSDINEPDGITYNSVQGEWLRIKLQQSTAKFKVVYFHHPSYSSSLHGNTVELQWPFKQWGTSIVLNGHDHSYERLLVDNFPYVVNGLGGRVLYGFSDTVQPGSLVRYSENFGAQLATVYEDSINFKLYNINYTLIDNFTIYRNTIGINNNTTLSEIFNLKQNYPNPFNPNTIIKFTVKQTPATFYGTETSLIVYDLLGREVSVLVKQELRPGEYEIDFDAAKLPSGVYFYELRTEDYAERKKMVLAK